MGAVDGILRYMKKIDSVHSCHSEFNDGQEASFPILYIRSDLLTNLSKRAGKKLFLGICGFSHRLFRVHHDRGGSAAEMMMIDDLIIKSGRCEMEKSCLALQCPLNRTPHSTMKKQINQPTRPHELDVLPLTADRLCGWFEKYPEGGIIVSKDAPQTRSRRAST